MYVLNLKEIGSAVFEILVSENCPIFFFFAPIEKYHLSKESTVKAAFEGVMNNSIAKSPSKSLCCRTYLQHKPLMVHMAVKLFQRLYVLLGSTLTIFVAHLVLCMYCFNSMVRCLLFQGHLFEDTLSNLSLASCLYKISTMNDDIILK